MHALDPIPNRLRHLATVLALLTAAALPLPGLGEEGPVERRYQFRFLEPDQALAIAQNLCPSDGVCSVSTSGRNELRMVAAASIQEQASRAIAAADVPPAAQAFHLTLLEAHRGGSEVPEGLPPAARKALADVAAFLPYGRFDLLSPPAFMRTTRHVNLIVGSVGDYAYELSLSFRGDPRQAGAELLVDTFRLRLVPSDPIRIALSLAHQPGAGDPAPHRAPVAAPSSSTPGQPGTTPPPAAAPTPPVAAESLLSTSFSIRKGETVVVGTSKLEGSDRALVVLLTALP